MEGGKQPGVVVLKASDLETGWTSYEQLSQKIFQKEKSFTSLALVWPSQETRKLNLNEFRKYWTEERAREMESKIFFKAAVYGFSKDAFRPFYNMLDAGALTGDEKMPELLLPFKERFLKIEEEGVLLLGYFEDSSEALSHVHSVVDEYPDAYVVSREELSDTISEQVFADMKKVSIFSISGVLMITVLFLKTVKKTLLALIPVATSVLVVFGVLSLFNIKANVVVLITLIVVLGLSIDYGIFLSSFKDGEAREPAIKAVTFSMLTTIAGTLGLLFASHPAMFVVGVTMISGIVSAYLSAIFSIPALEKVL
ncbi:membrane hypothetical protein [Desulfamplus magnetovallimortis]|uniref:Membrane transport protein MMPL domain-containing protein n=1 Tax=Desulfamplus magnetovallimortis TaxID=1246637 RepID=L0R4H9_9BACT|nr:MMPL family transporter [Desulfamplus magnetovallimortis]CCO06769.1 membrane hypothetical protein [Desulfamplus magnetovallimortis BW-1]SLM32820.1 membrane hypothetical protein [Desulfamplus magnetovallimortis]